MAKPSATAKVGDVFHYTRAEKLDRYMVIEIPSESNNGGFILKRIMRTPELQENENPFPFPVESFDDIMSPFMSAESLEIIEVRAMIVQAFAFGFIDEVRALLIEMEI